MALDLAAIEGMKITFTNSILNEIEPALEENCLKKILYSATHCVHFQSSGMGPKISKETSSSWRAWNFP